MLVLEELMNLYQSNNIQMDYQRVISTVEFELEEKTQVSGNITTAEAHQIFVTKIEGLLNLLQPKSNLS